MDTENVRFKTGITPDTCFPKVSKKTIKDDSIFFDKIDRRRCLDIRYARLGPKNALSAVPTSFPILIRKKFFVDETIFFDERDGKRRLNSKYFSFRH